MSDRRWIVPIDFSIDDTDEPLRPAVGDPEGEVLIPEGMLMGIFSEWGVGKTILQITTALSLAFGLPLLDFPVPRRRRVLVVLADGDPPKTTKQRIRRIARGLGITAERMSGCDRIRFINPEGFTFDGPDCEKELRQELDVFDPDVLIMETLTTLSVGERDMTRQADATLFIFTRIRPLMNRRPPHHPDDKRLVIVAGHLIKRQGGPFQKRTKDRIAMSFSVPGGIDAAISLLQTGEEDQFRVTWAKRPRDGSRFQDRIVDICGDPKAGEPLMLIEQPPAETEDGDRKGGRPADKRIEATAAIEKAYNSNPGLRQKHALKLLKGMCGDTLAKEVYKAVRLKRAQRQRAAELVGKVALTGRATIPTNSSSAAGRFGREVVSDHSDHSDHSDLNVDEWI